MEVREKTFEGRDPPRITAMGNVSTPAVLKKAVDDAAVYLGKGFFLFLEKKSKKEVNVAFVGCNTIFGKAFLGDQIVEKKLSCRNKLLWEGFAGDDRVG